MERAKADIRRYFTQQEIDKGISWPKTLKRILEEEALWMVLLYRFGNWTYFRCKNPIVRLIMKILYISLQKPLKLLLGININPGAEIGKGFYIGHFGGVWIGKAKIGEFCNISQEVTIGIGGRNDLRGLPEIGNRVYIGPGAKVYGKIKIGDDVAIGANAVVSKSVPDNAVVVGNPGRIIGYNGSEGLINLE
jgi:serine O-acetyltransferase